MFKDDNLATDLDAKKTAATTPMREFLEVLFA